MGIDPFTGALIGGIGSAVIGSRSSKRAANQIAGASDAATAEQRRQFDIATGLTRPAIDAGNTARDQLLRLLGLAPTAPQVNVGSFGGPIQDRDGLPPLLRQRLGLDTSGAAGVSPSPVSADPLDVIRNTPGFNFQLEQGTRALNANRSAGGSSGGELIKDFTRFNQGVASNFYQDYANRLANLAGTGQTAATNQANLGVQTGVNIGNTLQNAGTARASGVLGQSNAFGNLLNQLGQAAGQGLFTNPSSGSSIPLGGGQGGVPFRGGFGSPSDIFGS